MAQDNKTTPRADSVDEFVATLSAQRQAESRQLIDLMRRVSGQPPVMWGSSIIGFGTYHYTYASGRQGDWMKIGFSPRKAAISLYASCDAAQFADEIDRLHATHGKGCIYLKKLEGIDQAALTSLVQKAYDFAQDIDKRH